MVQEEKRQMKVILINATILKWPNEHSQLMPSTSESPEKVDGHETQEIHEELTNKNKANMATALVLDLNNSTDTLNDGSDDQNLDETSPIPASSKAESNESLPILPHNQKPYDYLLKVLLVGDSDVGKQEILSGLEDASLDSPFCSSAGGAAYKTTTILIDGKRVKLQLWDTSGQGRFCTIIRSYSRGAQGILLVYDITNKWSFEGIDRWLKEVDQVRSKK